MMCGEGEREGGGGRGGEERRGREREGSKSHRVPLSLLGAVSRSLSLSRSCAIPSPTVLLQSAGICSGSIRFFYWRAAGRGPRADKARWPRQPASGGVRRRLPPRSRTGGALQRPRGVRAPLVGSRTCTPTTGRGVVGCVRLVFEGARRETCSVFEPAALAAENRRVFSVSQEDEKKKLCFVSWEAGTFSKGSCGEEAEARAYVCVFVCREQGTELARKRIGVQNRRRYKETPEGGRGRRRLLEPGKTPYHPCISSRSAAATDGAAADMAGCDDGAQDAATPAASRRPAAATLPPPSPPSPPPLPLANPTPPPATANSTAARAT